LLLHGSGQGSIPPPSEIDIVTAIVANNTSLKKVVLISTFDSSDCILKVIECCPDIMVLSFHNVDGSLVLKRSDIEAIATLPLLKVLFVDCAMEEMAIDGLGGVKDSQFSRLVEVLPLPSLALSSHLLEEALKVADFDESTC
jgi:hypothetical protein